MDMTSNDDYCRFMFKRVMEYLNKNDVKNAGVSFVSDCNKKEIDLGILTMLFFSQTDKNELIKLVCGYPFMPPDLRQYYDNPEKAFVDYT